MKKFFIESVRCEEAEGGIACGPGSGQVVAEVEITSSKGEHFFISLAEVDGIPCFYKTKESTIDTQLNFMNVSEKEWAKKVADHELDLGIDYDEVLENSDDEYYDIYRYLIYIVRSDWTTSKQYMAETAKKYLHQISIPASDIEEEW